MNATCNGGEKKDCPLSMSFLQRRGGDYVSKKEKVVTIAVRRKKHGKTSKKLKLFYREFEDAFHNQVNMYSLCLTDVISN